MAVPFAVSKVQECACQLSRDANFLSLVGLVGGREHIW